MLNILWLIPALPLAGFLLSGLLGWRLGKRFVTAMALLASGGAAVAGTIAVVQYHAAHPHGERFVNVVYSWIASGNIGADLAFQLDPLSIVMLMVVTWVGALIHLYSVGYMAHEDGYWRYFAYLNLFLSEMLILILGANYLLMFVGWEGVGLCSYLLIGFYYKTDYAPAAGKKAFIVNRIGDFGFLVAVFLMFAYLGTVDFGTVATRAAATGVDPGLMTAICLLLFLGACGKSAQIPLYVWLPDAMAGPTPVSALIHAIAGFPPFAGFFSKDEILGSALSSPYLPASARYVIWGLGTIAALFTAYYMFRLVFLTFFGSFRGTHEQEHHLHESPATMTLPLIVLAFLSTVGGVALVWRHALAEWLAPIYPDLAGRGAEVAVANEYFLI